MESTLGKHDFFFTEGSKSLFNRRPLTILDTELPWNICIIMIFC